MAQAKSELYARQDGFVPPHDADEFLHPDAGETDDYTLSETSYLGFNIPEAGIDAEIYHWFHPKLGVTSGGLLIWQGNKHQSAEADYIDYRNFLPYPSGDIADYTYPTGVRVRVVKPLEELQIDFESADGSTRLALNSRAIMPPAGRLDGKHFAQAMRSTGELVLNGQTYEIDSYFTRDRSYSSPRVESAHPGPPLTWGAAVFGDDLALHFVGHDSPELSDDGLKWGYVWRDGELRRPVRLRKETLREADGVTPCGTDLELEDSAGDRYRMRGYGLARLPMSFWPNMVTGLVLMRYELEDGRVGHGDYQDVVFSQFLRAARNTD